MLQHHPRTTPSNSSNNKRVCNTYDCHYYPTSSSSSSSSMRMYHWWNHHTQQTLHLMLENHNKIILNQSSLSSVRVVVVVVFNSMSWLRSTCGLSLRLQANNLSTSTIPTTILRACASSSSKQWLSRQSTDQYVKKRAIDNVPSRAYYKLLQVLHGTTGARC
jgi:hypothetical protein